MATPKIELRGVKKRFGSKVVLDGVDLVIDKGESLVVIGGSGTGKSVTIKSVLGILRPDEGQIFVDGEEVTHIGGAPATACCAQFGMLFQGAALFDSLTVWEKRRVRLNPGPRHGAQAGEKTSPSPNSPRSASAPKSPACRRPKLSGGMQKRVGLARAIAADPEIIFFDEPTTASIPSWPTSSTT